MIRQETVDQVQHFRCVSGKDDPWGICYPIEGKGNVVKFLRVDPMAEVFSSLLSVHSRNIQNHASRRKRFGASQQKVIDAGMVLCQNAWPDSRVTKTGEVYSSTAATDMELREMVLK